jgi:hypothetical protein
VLHCPEPGTTGCCVVVAPDALEVHYEEPIEIWFSILSRKCLRRASVRSTQDLRTLIQRFMKSWNTQFAHPFEWTYTGKPLAVSPQQYELLAA